jgi:type I restriction enzyme, S subunit
MIEATQHRWRVIRFRDVLATGVRNGIYKPVEYHGRGAQIVNMGELFAHPRLRSVPMRRIDVDDSELERFGLKELDLLFARRSLVAEGAGKCSIVLEVNEPTVFESSIIRARPNADEADSLFLYYFWSSPTGAHLLDTIRRQVAVSGITGKDLEQLQIRIPPVEDQRAIAGVLGALDEKIEQNRRTAHSLERLARAIFQAWFVDFEPVKAKAAGATAFPSMPQPVFDALPTRFVDSVIGAVPQGWTPTAVSAAFDVNPVRSLRKDELAPYLDMKNMPTEGHAPASWIVRPVGSGMRFTNGDTLVARITPCLENGKTAFVDFLDDGQIAWGSTEYIVLRPRSPLPPVFAYCLARTDEFRDFAIQNMTGTSGRQRVAQIAMDHFQIAMPSESTAVCFGEIAQPLFNSIRSGMNESRKLAEMRDYLLPKLLSGGVRVQSDLTEKRTQQ